ncbi:MAG: DUF5679 domain-containing protein [Armatimonadota bacterium]|nr:DUF5679 domain-containing protein [Armatimonadota bacterium]
MQGYCVRCKAKQEMLSATRTLMKNGRRAMIGVCACCGTKMSVIGKWDGEPATATSGGDGEHPTPQESSDPV